MASTPFIAMVRRQVGHPLCQPSSMEAEGGHVKPTRSMETDLNDMATCLCEVAGSVVDCRMISDESMGVIWVGRPYQMSTAWCRRHPDRSLPQPACSRQRQRQPAPARSRARQQPIFRRLQPPAPSHPSVASVANPPTRHLPPATTVRLHLSTATANRSRLGRGHRRPPMPPAALPSIVVPLVVGESTVGCGSEKMSLGASLSSGSSGSTSVGSLLKIRD